MTATSRSFPAAILHLFLCLFFVCLSAHAQTTVQRNPEAEKTFSAAMDKFRHEQYADAAALFNSLAGMQPAHQYSTAAMLMAAKSYNAADEPAKALGMLAVFFRKYPDSKYQTDARYTLGVAELLSKKYIEAAVDLYRVGQADDPGLASKAQALLEYLAAERLHPADLDKFPTSAPGENARDEMTYLVAQRLYRNGKFSDAKPLIDSIIARRPGTTFSARAEELRGQIGKGVNLRIAAVLPLTQQEGNQQGVQGQDMLDGIKYALNAKRASLPAGLNIILDIHDSGRDPAHAKAFFDTLAKQKDLIGVIGPMFSNVAFACAPVANRDSLPMISPTANAIGIAATGPYVFQLNPDLAMHGRAMARYAVEKSGYKTLGIIASTDDALRPLIKSFYDEARRLGAQVVDIEWFQNPADELDNCCLRLRKAGLGGEPKINFGRMLLKDQIAGLRSRGVPQERIDELRRKKAEISVTELLGPFGGLIADTLRIPVQYPSVNARDLNKPLESIEGVFVPLTEADHMSIVLSQLNYYNIKTQVLGNAEWNNVGALEANRHAANGAIFCSDTYIDKSDSMSIRFGNGFYSINQKSPSRYTMFGYDAMDLVLEQIVHGVATRQALANGLASVPLYHGVHSTIALNGGRVNSSLNILKYSGGAVNRIAEISGK